MAIYLLLYFLYSHSKTETFGLLVFNRPIKDFAKVKTGKVSGEMISPLPLSSSFNILPIYPNFRYLRFPPLETMNYFSSREK